MANNRMYLVCTVCRDEGEPEAETQFMLAKCMLDGYYIPEQNEKLLSSKLDEFFDKHVHWPQTQFVIGYDSE